jgi:hypothetical protein
MSGDSDVSGLVDDHEQSTGEGIAKTKGIKAMHLTTMRHKAENDEANRLHKVLERSDSRRVIPMTLPKLKFLDEPENEL